MGKTLKRGILLIRKYAEKYKNAIMQTLKLKSIKKIHKKNRRKKKTFKIIEKNNNNNYKEKKKRKLYNYLINQEKELDFQENYTFFNKFYNKSDILFYNLEDNNIPDSLKGEVSGEKGRNQNYNSDNGNYIDSLNFLKNKIKQEIKENNDLLSYQKINQVNKNNEIESKSKTDFGLKKISYTNENLKRKIEIEKNFNKEQLHNPNTKKGGNYEINQNNRCEKKCINGSDIEPNENYESMYLKRKKIKLHENNDEESKSENIANNYNTNSKKIIDDILYKSNEIFTDIEKNDLVFGKNKFESINEICQQIFEGNAYDKSKEDEINEYHNEVKCDQNEIGNEYSKNNVNIYNNILKITDDANQNECLKGKVNNQDNKEISEQSDKNNNDNQYNFNISQKNNYKNNTEDTNSCHDQNNSEEIKKNYNILTPFKEDNSFDLFFNDSFGTPSIFQI